MKLLRISKRGGEGHFWSRKMSLQILRLIFDQNHNQTFSRKFTIYFPTLWKFIHFGDRRLPYSPREIKHKIQMSNPLLSWNVFFGWALYQKLSIDEVNLFMISGAKLKCTQLYYCWVLINIARSVEPVSVIVWCQVMSPILIFLGTM